MARKKNAGAKHFGKPLTDDPDDAPELLNDFFRRGELRHGDRLIRRGRPPLSGMPKTAITLRLDEDLANQPVEVGIVDRLHGQPWQQQVGPGDRQQPETQSSQLT